MFHQPVCQHRFSALPPDPVPIVIGNATVHTSTRRWLRNGMGDSRAVRLTMVERWLMK